MIHVSLVIDQESIKLHFYSWPELETIKPKSSDLKTQRFTNRKLRYFQAWTGSQTLSQIEEGNLKYLSKVVVCVRYEKIFPERNFLVSLPSSRPRRQILISNSLWQKTISRAIYFWWNDFTGKFYDSFHWEVDVDRSRGCDTTLPRHF